MLDEIDVGKGSQLILPGNYVVNVVAVMRKWMMKKEDGK